MSMINSNRSLLDQTSVLGPVHIFYPKLKKKNKKFICTHIHIYKTSSYILKINCLAEDVWGQILEANAQSTPVPLSFNKRTLLYLLYICPVDELPFEGIYLEYGGSKNSRALIILRIYWFAKEKLKKFRLILSFIVIA